VGTHATSIAEGNSSTLSFSQEMEAACSCSPLCASPSREKGGTHKGGCTAHAFMLIGQIVRKPPKDQNHIDVGQIVRQPWSHPREEQLQTISHKFSKNRISALPAQRFA
jgi:hypothetical protein